MKFIAWRGARVLCRCGCGRLAAVRPVEFVKEPLAGCPACRVWLALALRGSAPAIPVSRAGD